MLKTTPLGLDSHLGPSDLEVLAHSIPSCSVLSRKPAELIFGVIVVLFSSCWGLSEASSSEALIW